ncbi:MAG TPA: response regulator [Thermoanaerobaculia bacterium]|nr:response regulator [Thermoanaerobaculia bacterium]
MTESIRMLLVHREDEDSRRLMARLAPESQPPIDVVHLDRTAAACERLTEESFDLILLDLALPDEPGLDAFIRLNAQLPETPVVVISSPATQDLAALALEAGAADLLSRSWIETDPVQEILFAIIQRSRFDQAIRRREKVDDETGLYTAEGFVEIASKHLMLAQRGGKHLLLAALEPSGPAEDAAPIIKRAFRGSDAIGIVGETLAALAIVHPDDEGESIISLRLGEVMHDHNATHRPEKRIELRWDIIRFRPEPQSTVEDLLAVFPKPAKTVE